MPGSSTLSILDRSSAIEATQTLDFGKGREEKCHSLQRRGTETTLLGTIRGVLGHGGLYEGGFSKTGGGMVGAAGGLRATRQPQLFPVTGQ